MRTALIINTSLLSGNIHEELRSAGVGVIGLMVGRTTCIDTLQGVYSFALRTSDFLSPPIIYLYKTDFLEIFFWHERRI